MTFFGSVTGATARGFPVPVDGVVTVHARSG
jgi:hypothetical protein